MADHYTGGGDKTVAKLVTLEKYVGAYTAIITNNWSTKPWYIDTHAATGFVDMDEYGSKVPGSAVRILRNHQDDFDRFYFYESNGDSFELLRETLARELGLDFDSWTNSAGFPVAKSENPRVMLLQTNSNEGIQWLCEKANEWNHWFVFMDPRAVTDLEADAIRAVTTRGNTDLLINFQTTGVHRAAGWNPSRGSVEQLGGNEPLEGGELDDQVEWFRKAIEESSGYNTASRKTVSETSRGHRFDLVFASGDDTAVGIMDDIMTKSLKKEIAKEISNYRVEGGQLGLESWRSIKFMQHGDESEAESQRGDGQSGLSEFS